MKTRYIFITCLSAAILAFSTGCTEKVIGPDFPAPDPKTEIGRAMAGADGIMASLYKDTCYTVTPGVEVTEMSYLSYSGHAMAAYFYEVDLNEEQVTIAMTTAANKPVGKALQPVTQQALAADSPEFYIWGGTNSDFFDMKKGTNLPHGIFVHNGVEQKGFFNPQIKRDMSFFYITKDKRAGIGLEAEYEEVAAEGNLLEACGGGELLVSHGNAMKPAGPEEPRTCVGISEDGKTVYIMVVDGRRYEYSFGITLVDLAKCMQSIGAFTAINLDGGGSTTFYVRDKKLADDDEGRFVVRNWPSDNGGLERSTANGLAIVSIR